MRSQCIVESATLRGVEAVPVRVEVVVSNGLPGMAIVGMADVSVQEARERVRAAIGAAGFSMPAAKIVVNLAPADLRKSGSSFDLPIAAGVLAATGQVDPAHLRGRLLVGELSLDGRVRPVHGTLAFGLCASGQGLALVSAVDGDRVPLRGLEQLGLKGLGMLHGEESFLDLPWPGKRAEGAPAAPASPDFRDVAGHEMAKRALQVAAAGGHGVLMMGPPGSGKTMLASRIGSILPPLGEEEMLEAAVVHSVAGEPIDELLQGVRPFRHPHHSATMAGLVGGGSPVRPGEASLAHHGVLFLDELAEFGPSALQGLRQPMESGEVTLTRADGKVRFPARFMLVAAANPCRCGYFGDDAHPCTCTLPQIHAYQGRIGGPLIDRIGIQLDIRRQEPGSVLSAGEGASSAQLREGVLRARAFAERRRARFGPSAAEAEGPREAVRACRLDEGAREFAESMARAQAMSGRALVSTLRVGRTIADLEESDAVRSEHLAEAMGLRVRDGIGG